MLHLVVADDLTGAADAAAPFAMAGRRTQLVLGAVTPGEPAWTRRERVEVVALTTESRRLPPAVAAERVGDACRGLGAAEVFKKVDSTLRGNVHVEVEAAARAVGATEVVVCPAFPAVGRTVVDGTLCLWGRPVARVADHVPAGAVVVDASTDADLDAVAARHGPGVLLVGSGGLAAAVARAGPQRARPAPPPPGRGTIVVVAGSDHEATRSQAGALVGCTVIVPPPAPGAEPLAVARLLARQAVGCWPGPVAGLVLSGGETAAAVLSALGACAIDLVGELEAGVPLGRVVGGRADGVPVVLKAGGFGDRETLVHAVEWLRR